jgi:hypothetical protein
MIVPENNIEETRISVEGKHTLRVEPRHKDVPISVINAFFPPM